MKQIYKILFCFLVVFTLFACIPNNESNNIDSAKEQKQNLNKLIIFIDYENGKSHSGSITVHWAGIIK